MGKIRKLMIVDDEALPRMNLRTIVPWERYGYTVAGEAANGRQALAMARSLLPDVIFTDIKMPVMDGLELMRHLREDGNPAKIVILSCYEDFGYAQEAIRLGAVDYLLKHTYEEEDVLGLIGKLEAVFERESMSAQGLSKLRLELLRRRLEDEMERDEIEHYEELGLLPHGPGPYLVVYVSAPPGFPLADDDEEILSVPLSDREVGYLLTFPPRTSFAFARETAEDWSSGLFQSLAGAQCPWRYGCSRVHDDWTALPAAFREAKLVAGAGADLHGCSAKVRLAVDYIQSHFSSPISLDDIACAAGISRIYLSQIFKKETGCNVSEFLLQYRMEKAKDLLRSSSLKVYQVAELAGFGSAQYFSHLFKKLTGVNPYEYREKD